MCKYKVNGTFILIRLPEFLPSENTELTSWVFEKSGTLVEGVMSFIIPEITILPDVPKRGLCINVKLIVFGWFVSGSLCSTSVVENPAMNNGADGIVRHGRIASLDPYHHILLVSVKRFPDTFYEGD